MQPLRVLAVLLVGAVFTMKAEGASTLKIPDFLPTGKRFPGGQDVTVVAFIFHNSKNPDSTPQVDDQVEASYKGEGMIEASNAVLKKLGNSFNPPVSQGDVEYSVVTVFWENFHRTEDDNHLLAYQYTGTAFKLQNGKIPETFLTVTPRYEYKDYIPVYVPGLKEVLFEVWNEKILKVQEKSSNGAGPFTGISPGESDYEGPDVLQLRTQFFVPGQQEDLLSDKFEIKLTLYFSEDRKVFATYDRDGTKIASREVTAEPVAPPPVTPPPTPQPSAFRLKLTPITGLASLDSSKQSEIIGMRLAIEGPPSPVVFVEYTDALKSGWNMLATLQMTNGSVEFADFKFTNSARRFYRAARMSGNP